MTSALVRGCPPLAWIALICRGAGSSSKLSLMATPGWRVGHGAAALPVPIIAGQARDHPVKVTGFAHESTLESSN